MRSDYTKIVDDITVIDISDFPNADSGLRQHVADLFVQTIASEGLVGFEGHPACDPAIDLADWVERLFALPLEKYETHGMDATRGFSRGFRDQMMWHTGPELSADNPLAARLPANRWVDELPGFKEAILEMFSLLENLSYQMMSMLALGLRGNESEWRAAIENHSSVFRFVYFPAHGDFAPDDIRLVDHIDPGMFALVPPAAGGGFEVVRNESWFSVPSHQGIIFTYPGQMTEYLTNAKIKAVNHRVTSRGYRDHRRLSFPYFMIPHPDFRLTPPAVLVDAETGPVYPEYTVEELLFRYFQQYLSGGHDSGWARDVLSE